MCTAAKALRRPAWRATNRKMYVSHGACGWCAWLPQRCGARPCMQRADRWPAGAGRLAAGGYGGGGADVPGPACDEPAGGLLSHGACSGCVRRPQTVTPGPAHTPAAASPAPQRKPGGVERRGHAAAVFPPSACPARRSYHQTKCRDHRPQIIGPRSPRETISFPSRKEPGRRLILPPEKWPPGLR